MNMSIRHSTLPSQPVKAAPAAATGAREAFASLGKALRGGDLDAAKVAYADVLRTAPEGATLTRGSAFVQLGSAIVKGDVGAAKAAYAEMVKARPGASLPGLPGGTLPLPAQGATDAVPASGGLSVMA